MKQLKETVNGLLALGVLIYLMILLGFKKHQFKKKWKQRSIMTSEHYKYLERTFK